MLRLYCSYSCLFQVIISMYFCIHIRTERIFSNYYTLFSICEENELFLRYRRFFNSVSCTLAMIFPLVTDFFNLSIYTDDFRNQCKFLSFKFNIIPIRFLFHFPSSKKKINDHVSFSILFQKINFDFNFQYFFH